MSEAIKTGGPAFPVLDVHQDWDQENHDWGGVHTAGSPGMSLRDYFAAKAMQGFVTGDWFSSPDAKAAEAYRIADAILKARKQ